LVETLLRRHRTNVDITRRDDVGLICVRRPVDRQSNAMLAE
jgi:hypothetical protein